VHIVRSGGKYAREQKRLYTAKAVIFVLVAIACLFFTFSHRWVLILVFFFLSVGLHYLRKSRNWHKGILGEKMVVEALATLDNSYVLINDIILPGRKGNIDHILICPKGIFVIETKSYKWHYLNRFPIRQIIRSASSLRYFLKEHIQLDVFVHALLISTHPDVTSQSSSNFHVRSLKDLHDCVKDHRTQSVLDRDPIRRLVYEIRRVARQGEK